MSRKKNGPYVGHNKSNPNQPREKYYTFDLPQLCDDLDAGQVRHYVKKARELVIFFTDVEYPGIDDGEGPPLLPNGVRPFNLRKYVWVQIETMRFHFIRHHHDIFLYFFHLLTDIKNLPIWKTTT